MNNTLRLFNKLLIEASNDLSYNFVDIEVDIDENIFTHGLIETSILEPEQDYVLSLGFKVNGYYIECILVPFLWEQLNEDAIVLRPNLSVQPLLSSQIINHGGTKKKFGVCEQEVLDSILDKQAPVFTDDWHVWVQHGISLFENCAGYRLADFFNIEDSRKNLVSEFKARVYQYKSSGAIFLKSLYKCLGTKSAKEMINSPISTALLAFEGGDKSENISKDDLHEKVSKKPEYLIGHMDEDEGKQDINEHPIKSRGLFALDNSQRMVNYYIDGLSDGDILAVNGPPGSGKTAMMKSVIANQFVNAALGEGDCPIILAVGDTNQSVTNVISAFPEVAYKGEAYELVHYKRWLPHVNNYGTYLPSTTKYEDLKKHNQINGKMIARPNKDGSSLFEWKGFEQNILTDFTEIDTLKITYLESANKFASFLGTEKYNNVESVIEDLNRQLLKLKNVLATRKLKLDSIKGDLGELSLFFTAEHLATNRNQVASIYNNLKGLLGTQSEKLEIIKSVARETLKDKAKTEPLSLISQCQQILIDRYLDVTIRVEMFHVAARYWEGRYLIACENEILLKNTPDNIEEALRRMCMLTPCLVSTLDNSPNLFRIYKDTISGVPEFLLGKVDLLIIDETGQAATPKGIPVLALAKKVLAVGDVLQLQPVVKDFTPAHEKGIFNQFGYNDKAYAALKKENLLSTKGSLLHLLRKASRFSYQGRGLLLRGHYRCQEIIIEACNQIVYDGKLFLADHCYKAKSLFPPLSWVESEQSGQQVDGSRVNVDEAQKIASFIYFHWSEIYEFHKKKSPRIYDIIGIISPFKHQPKLIKDELQLLLDKQPLLGEYDITPDDMEKLTSGTVNALQGAEKPIIIFSSVKTGKDSGTSFFDEQPYLLNVALSRARDHFIAFICPSEYQMDKPSDDETTEEGYVQKIGAYLKERGEKLFPRHLVIIEAPGKCDTIQSMLSSYYEVVACKGRTFEQVDPLDIHTKNVTPKYKINSESYDLVHKISQKSVGMESVIIATDEDHAGEFIGWHLAKQLTIINPDLADKIRHVRLSQITEDSIKKTIINFPTHQKDIAIYDSAIVNAEAIRDVIDFYIAQRLSEALRNSPRKNSLDLSALIDKGLVVPADERNFNKVGNRMGRVKTGIISIVNQRLEQNKEIVHANLTVNEKTFQGIVTKNAKEMRDRVFLNGTQQYSSNPKNWPNVMHQTEKIVYEPPCASTLNIIRLAWERADIAPQDTLNFLQALYEGSFYDQ